MSTKGFINNTATKSEATLEKASNLQPTRLYDFSRCSSGSEMSEISSLSSKKTFKELCHSRSGSNEWDQKGIISRAKHNFLFVEDDVSSLTSFSLLSSEDNCSPKSKFYGKRNVNLGKCDHNDIEGCEICIVYRRTFRSYN